MKPLKIILDFLVVYPHRIGKFFEWVGPLLARFVAGYVFMITGWAKLQNLENVTTYFTELGIPFPHIMTPFVAGLECFGGFFLIFGLLTRISGGGLAITMIVAILTAKWNDIENLEALLGFEETLYFTIFTWLAICGGGKASIDYIIVNRCTLKPQETNSP